MNRNTYSSKPYDKDTSRKLRERLIAALEDPAKQKIELQILNDLLIKKAIECRRALQDGLTNLFNQVSPRGGAPGMNFTFGDDPQLREENKAVITGLMRGAIKTSLFLKIEISPRLTSYSSADVRHLDGYRELHNIAQLADIAINVRGLTAKEKDPPAIVFDALKSYAEGESDSKYGYPDLLQPLAETPAAEKAAFSRMPVKRYTM